MIKSMTGFGRCEVQEAERKITVEMKSVNHRYLDVNIKMPKKLNFFEASIRNLLKEYIQRGKVDLFISFEDLSENSVNVTYHKEVAAEYMNFNKTITVRNEDGSKKGELSLDMEEPLELRNMSLRLKLNENTNTISVVVDSEYSESTDREKQETQISLPEDAFAGMSYNDYTYECGQVQFIAVIQE